MANTDESHLLRIFPTEVWDMILFNVKEVKDYQEISSSCSYFQNRLRPQRTKILFPDVMKSLTKHDDFHPDNFLDTRGVCRAWKIGLDQILATQEYFPKYEYTLSQMRGMNSASVDLDFDVFDSMEDFSMFENNFDSSHKGVGANPFVGRKVKLVFESGNEIPETLYDACFQFLKKYGQHIWFCIIDLRIEDDDDQSEMQDFYGHRLNDILSLMPNLIALQIEQDVLSDELPSSELSVEIFPTLPHLEYISVSRVPFPIVENLFQRNLHVKYVDAIQLHLRKRAVFVESLSELRALSLFIGDNEELREFEQARFARPVERFWLDLMDLEYVTTEQVFRTMERQFASSLVELYLSLPNRESIGATTRLELPSLRFLYLEMKEPQRLDFLLPLRDTLEELQLAVVLTPNPEVNCKFELPEFEKDEVHVPSKFQVYRFWLEPQKSGIWPVFPKLKLFKQKVFDIWPQYCCNRKDWEAVMEKKSK